MEKLEIGISNELAGYFGEGGAVSRAIRHFETRPQQFEMACAVEASLKEKRHLVVEAGTGVGKSLAYLLPCALWSVKSGSKVLVATYTKALQEQLAKKDLPLVKSIVGANFNYAMLMGADNYLCLARLYRALKREPELFEKVFKCIAIFVNGQKIGHVCSVRVDRPWVAVLV
ncbi:MAG: DEAD/DEAH box helicase [Elusimicrobia bacterium]|nr:DEAD/DEAH box helicase [Elusimicrobiota bacterium]